MRQIDPDWLSATADVLINLAAGWFGAAIIVPTVTPSTSDTEILTLLNNIIFGTVSLWTAVQLKKKAHRYL